MLCLLHRTQALHWTAPAMTGVHAQGHPAPTASQDIPIASCVQAVRYSLAAPARVCALLARPGSCLLLGLAGKHLATPRAWRSATSSAVQVQPSFLAGDWLRAATSQNASST